MLKSELPALPMNPATKTVFIDLESRSGDLDEIEEQIGVLANRLSESGVEIGFLADSTFEGHAAFQQRLGIKAVCVLEHGSAVFIPREKFSEQIEGISEKGSWYSVLLGLRFEEVRRRIQRVESLIGETLLGIRGMPVEDVARLTGLDLITARRVQERDYSEIIAVKKDDEFWEGMDKVFEEYGLSRIRGARFQSIVGQNADPIRAVGVYSEIWESSSDRAMQVATYTATPEGIAAALSQISGHAASR